MGKIIFTAYVVMLVLFSDITHANGWYVSIGGGLNTNLIGDAIPWEDQSSLGFAGSLRYEWMADRSRSVSCGWDHYSQWFVGSPWDERAESALDHIGCSARYNF